MRNFKLPLIILIFIIAPVSLTGRDYYISGKITNRTGSEIQGALVSMIAGNKEYRTLSGKNGIYNLKIHGIYGSLSGLLETGTPYPTPFRDNANIPFIINTSGDIHFEIYSITGKKVFGTKFPEIQPGSYVINWNGCSTHGTSVTPGLYIYALTFRGETWSGRLIRGPGNPVSSAGTFLETAMLPSDVPDGELPLIRIITSVEHNKYYDLRLTDIKIRQDTIIDFILDDHLRMPFKTKNGHIALLTDTGYRSLILKGINLGACPPGTFPGEIAYAVPPEYYESWINRIGETGFNCIRVYTLHPPVFYEKLSNYNYRHPEDPILLFQGIWLEEVNDPALRSENDLFLRTQSFITEIRDVIDCIHGNRKIPFRYGKAYGNYLNDISRWTAAYITGREVSPQEVDVTNWSNPLSSLYYGYEFNISDASPSEVFVTKMMDETVKYEDQTYSSHRPVSFSSWPTLDPLVHPTEILTDEDRMSVDISGISFNNEMAGYFATYHAYPYYPNFISDEPSYRDSSDAEGANSYLGYLAGLKDHYGDIPLVVGEFGVPSSWGSAHESFSNMDHGGYSESEQGQKNIRMIHNILDAGCAGGFMFSWMDEWFKPTWIVQFLETYGYTEGSDFITTRQLWLNITSPEQNFGLISFEQQTLPAFSPYRINKQSGPVSEVAGRHDNSFFYADINFNRVLQNGDTIIIAFDTYSDATGESILPNGRSLENRSEFCMVLIAGTDTADFFVTQAYDMKGLTPRFNLSDSSIQKYKSIVSDGNPWNLMQWINDGSELTICNIGRLPVENNDDFTPGMRTAVAWKGSDLKLRIPWTMLNVCDPTRMQVIDGATISNDGRSVGMHSVRTDGIALSIYLDKTVTSTENRYIWDDWYVVPNTIPREKKSLHLVETELLLIPDFAN